MVRSGSGWRGEAGASGGGRALGLGSGRSPGWAWGLLWERERADAGPRRRCCPLFQVLLHVLFEHAVGYALLALKEVEEVSLLQPQVRDGDGLAGGTGPGPAARSHVAG